MRHKTCATPGMQMIEIERARRALIDADEERIKRESLYYLVTDIKDIFAEYGCTEYGHRKLRARRMQLTDDIAAAYNEYKIARQEYTATRNQAAADRAMANKNEIVNRAYNAAYAQIQRTIAQAAQKSK